MRLMELEHIEYVAYGDEPPCTPLKVFFDPTKVREVRPYPMEPIRARIAVDIGWQAVEIYKVAETVEEFMRRREDYL